MVMQASGSTVCQSHRRGIHNSNTNDDNDDGSDDRAGEHSPQPEPLHQAYEWDDQQLCDLYAQDNYSFGWCELLSKPAMKVDICNLNAAAACKRLQCSKWPIGLLQCTDNHKANTCLSTAQYLM